MKENKAIQHAIRWVASAEWAILLLASPFFIFTRPSFSPVLLLLPALWAIRRYGTGYFVPRTPVDWPILGLLVMVLASIWITPDLPLSLDRIAGLLFSIALFYAMVDRAHRRQSADSLAWGLVGIGCAVAGVGLVGTQWAIKFPALRTLYVRIPQAIRGVPGAETGFNANQVAGTLILVVPLQICLLVAYVRENERQKLWQRPAVGSLALSLVITGGMLFLLQSRASWAALVLTMVLLGAIAIPRVRVPVVVLACVALLAIAILGPADAGRSLFIDWTAVTGARPLRWDARMEIWSRGIWIISEYPLTGPGMNMHRKLVPFVYPTFVSPHEVGLAHPHSIYLQAAVDLGIPGLICFLAVAGGVLSAGWRAFTCSRERMTRAILLGAMGGLFAFSVWGTVDAISLGAKSDFVWWAVAATIVAASRDVSITDTSPSAGGVH